MNWLVNGLLKEARRFRENDSVRYFVHPRKGTGRGIILTPSFQKGRIVDYDSALRRYRVRNETSNEEILVHPRNLVPNSVSPNIQKEPQETNDIIDESVSSFDNMNMPPTNTPSSFENGPQNEII